MGAPKKTEAKPKNAPPVLTRARWQELPGLQQELQAILDSPVFQMACQTLLRTALPNAAPTIVVQPGVSAEAMIYADAARYHNRSGFGQFQRALNALARLKTNKDRGADWGELELEDE